jgi:hypothetical protein
MALGQMDYIHGPTLEGKNGVYLAHSLQGLDDGRRRGVRKDATPLVEAETSRQTPHHSLRHEVVLDVRFPQFVPTPCIILERRASAHQHKEDVGETRALSYRQGVTNQQTVTSNAP